MPEPSPLPCVDLERRRPDTRYGIRYSTGRARRPPEPIGYRVARSAVSNMDINSATRPLAAGASG